MSKFSGSACFSHLRKSSSPAFEHWPFSCLLCLCNLCNRQIHCTNRTAILKPCFFARWSQFLDTRHSGLNWMRPDWNVLYWILLAWITFAFIVIPVARTACSIHNELIRPLRRPIRVCKAQQGSARNQLAKLLRKPYVTPTPCSRHVSHISKTKQVFRFASIPQMPYIFSFKTNACVCDPQAL